MADKHKHKNKNGNGLDHSNEPIVESTTTTGKEKAHKTKDPVADMQGQLDELKDKYLRLVAEFDNYKKRTARERIELEQMASKNLLLSIIPALDDFERARKISEEENSPEPFSEGVKLVYHKLITALKSKGLQAFDPTGEPFDAELHEAITELDMGPAMSGKVIDTVERGYKLNDHIIKYAKVVVGK